MALSSGVPVCKAGRWDAACDVTESCQSELEVDERLHLGRDELVEDEHGGHHDEGH